MDQGCGGGKTRLLGRGTGGSSGGGHRSPRRACFVLGLGIISAGVLPGCQPTVKVEAPDKPIVINLNVKIEQDVRVRLEKGVEEVLSNNPDIF